MKLIVWNNNAHKITLVIKPTVKIQDGSDQYMFHVMPGQSIDLFPLGFRRAKPRGKK